MGLDLVMCGEAGLDGDPVDADERDVQVETLQGLFGDGTHQLVGLGSCRTARHHELDVRADGELSGDVERVRHHRDPVPIHDASGDFRGGRSSREPDHRAVRDMSGGLRRDPLLLHLVPGSLVPEG